LAIIRAQDQSKLLEEQSKKIKESSKLLDTEKNIEKISISTAISSPERLLETPKQNIKLINVMN
jgi:hypothetical protein